MVRDQKRRGPELGATVYRRFGATIFGVVLLITAVPLYPFVANAAARKEGARPAPQKSIPPKSDPQKSSSKKATVEAVFLHKTYGNVVRCTTQPGEKKTPMQEFLEKLLVAHPRKDAPGRWIDNVPDTKPTKQDIAPRLPDKTLYFDKDAANAHWPAFEKRNPKTADYLKKHMARPWIMKMPGDAAIAGKWDKKLAKSFVKAWSDDSEKFLSNSSKYKNTPQLYFVSIGECVLYADFLISRGDDAAKSVGFDLLNAGCFALDLHIRPYAPDKMLGWYVGREMLWPAVDMKAGRFNRWVPVFLSTTLRNLKGKDAPERLHVAKWAVKHTPCDNNFKRLLLIMQWRAYAMAGDHIGAVIAFYGGIPPDGWDPGNLSVIRNRMVKAFGKDAGAERFRQYLEILLPNSGERRKFVENALHRERAAHYTNTRQYDKALENLQKLDPKGRNRNIQREIREIRKSLPKPKEAS